jgi:PPM family protein phosphatase
VRGSSRIARLSGAATDVGRVRSHNEDTFLLRPDLGLYLVADGMGGHHAGDVASAMVRLSMTNFFEVTQRARWADEFTTAEDRHLVAPAQRLAAAIRKANLDVYTASTDHIGAWGMGSTVVAAHLPDDSDDMFVAHVGDSRCYRIRAGKLALLTRDHSLVNEALALDPTMTPDDLARLPHNIITRALGMEPTVQVDVGTVDVRDGDTFLLCSDGLSGLLDDSEIVEAITLVDDASEVCDLLVAMANDAGGLDNITALALRV